CPNISRTTDTACRKYCADRCCRREFLRNLANFKTPHRHTPHESLTARAVCRPCCAERTGKTFNPGAGSRTRRRARRRRTFLLDLGWISAHSDHGERNQGSKEDHSI